MVFPYWVSSSIRFTEEARGLRNRREKEEKLQVASEHSQILCYMLPLANQRIKPDQEKPYVVQRAFKVGASALITYAQRIQVSFPPFASQQLFGTG